MNEYTMEQFCEILGIDRSVAQSWMLSGEIKPAITCYSNGTKSFKYYDADVEKARELLDKKIDGEWLSNKDILEKLALKKGKYIDSDEFRLMLTIDKYREIKTKRENHIFNFKNGGRSGTKYFYTKDELAEIKDILLKDYNPEKTNINANSGDLLNLTEIAQKLSVTENTARNYLKKLGIKAVDTAGRFLIYNLSESDSKRLKDEKINNRKRMMHKDTKEMEITIKDLSQNIATRNAENDELSRENCDLKFERDNLKQELAETQANNKKLKDKLAELNNLDAMKVEELRRNGAILANENDLLKISIKDLKANIENLKAEIRLLKTEKNSINSKLTYRVKVNEKLQQELETLRAELDDLKAKKRKKFLGIF